MAFNKKINYVRLLSCDWFCFLKNRYLSEWLKQNFDSIIWGNNQPNPHRICLGFLISWSRGSDSNRHVISDSGFWVRRVYQFHHLGKVLMRILNFLKNLSMQVDSDWLFLSHIWFFSFIFVQFQRFSAKTHILSAILTSLILTLLSHHATFWF